MDRLEKIKSDGLDIAAGDVRWLIEEVERLRERDYWLICLENAGVDNWGGFGYAQEMYNEDSE